ncbi:hypothetical protein UF75_2899 [Desulfosporosinus sp. I2]|uniref:ATP-binding protein n=1 Tax=Desulfosporosinus sp. I2 TaxID=1617025 RepID=UPI0005EE75B8|nr:ATP-binding protein [Desulfosporosinus sp. I2]KJR46716.1 hypothetical protein UF75_2899 [Desulfosporosinus sp. I2]
MATIFKQDLEETDLTQYNATFPMVSDEALFRDSLVRHLAKMFSKNRKVIMVQGDVSTGKTILLAQFTKYYSDRTFSFFVGEDYWGHNTIRFLQEICEQMKHAIKINSPHKISSINLEFAQEYELKGIFNKLYSCLINEAKRGKGPFYFVIDGLHLIPDNFGEENLIKLLPSGADNVYVLVSTRETKEYNFKYEPWDILGFSQEETQKYLADCMSVQQALIVHKACEGMPGYLDEIKRQINNGTDVDELINGLPTAFNNLLEKEWNKLQIKDESVLMILALLSYSLNPLFKETIEDILELDSINLESNLAKVRFIRENPESKVIDLMGSYKTFLSNKLIDYKPIITQKQISYFEKDKESGNSFINLPTLYKKSDNFAALTALLSTESLVQFIDSSKQVSLARRNLRILAEMAYEHKDWQRLSWAAIVESVFTGIVTSPPVLENEINAMLSLGNHEEALKQSYACVLPEDRLKLLGTVCNYMRRKKLDIPNHILSTLEDTVNLVDNTLDLNDELVDKLLDICTNIFHVKANLALKLLKRIASKTHNLQTYKGKLMDILLTKMYLRLESEGELDNIRAQIQNQSLRDFCKATSSSIAGMSTESILNEVNEISDVSVKLFLLQSWCNINAKQQDGSNVVAEALRIMTGSQQYTPTQLHLRQFAQPLRYCKNSSISKELVIQIDILKATVLKNPLDEYTRLELVLAEVEKQWSEEAAISRLYNVYFSIDELPDVDTKCYILVRLLISLSKIIPDDKALEKEITERLNLEYQKLMDESANHLDITKRLIAATTRYDHNIAFALVKKLNMETRRDEGYTELLKVYTDQAFEKIDNDFILHVLDQIQNVYQRNWILVQIIDRFSKKNTSILKSEKLKYIKKVDNIHSFQGRAYGYAFGIKWISKDDPVLAEELNTKLLDSVKRLEPLWEQVRVGFEITDIIADVDVKYGQKIFDLAVEKRRHSFADERISKIYINTCDLVIRMIPSIINEADCAEKINLIKKAIMFIPSSLHQCNLLTDLGLRCLLSGRDDFFKDVAKKTLDIIEKIDDIGIYNQSIIQSAPLLYEYERNIIFEKVKFMPLPLQDSALQKIIDYLFSCRPPSDPVDIKSLPENKIDYVDAQKICEVLELLNTDGYIYENISILVNSITVISNKYGNKKLTSNLKEKHLLIVAEKLHYIIHLKLPDARNIKHMGYLIACKACLCKLRDAAMSTPYRATDRWNRICPEWNVIKQEAMLITNIADRAFVLAMAGVEAYAGHEIMGTNFLKSAEDTLVLINNHVDRANRFQIVAEAYKDISNEISAQYLVKEAAKLAQMCAPEEGRDQLLGNIIELAHSIDQNLATNIASQVDNIVTREEVEGNIQALTLHADPKRIDNMESVACRNALNDACRRVLTSLCSGRGMTQHDELIAKWIYHSLGQNYETVFLVISWFIENAILKNKRAYKESTLNNIFSGTMAQLGMIIQLGQLFNQPTASTEECSNSVYQYFDSDTLTFSMGQREEAIATIQDWLAENTGTYIKIYDPDFRSDDLEILKAISQNSRVQIITSCKLAEWNNGDIPNSYKQHWHKICDQVPPDTLIFMAVTESGKTPMNDRFILSDEVGLQLGASINGLGKRDSTIIYLSYEEKAKAEQNIINPLIVSPPSEHEGERLSLKSFSL